MNIINSVPSALDPINMTELTETSYHPNVCHICHRNSAVAKLKKCSNCGMVAYCSVEHQRRHWKRHKEFCNAVVSVVSNECWHSELKTLTVKEARLCLRILVEQFLKRPLTNIEFKMIYFHKSCSFCYTKNELKECSDCLTFMVCAAHSELFNHFAHECVDFKLALDVQTCISTKNPINVKLCERITSNYCDIQTFISKNLVNGDSLTPEECALTSAFVTRPLSVVYALSTLQYNWPSDLLIHVVGADDFETTTHRHWNILLRLGLVTKLRLVFVGPDVAPIDSPSSDIGAVSVRMLYHEYAPTAEKPDVICSFNCGIVETDQPGCMWRSSLENIALSSSIIVLTSYNVSEAVADVEYLRKLSPSRRVLQFRNPFASLSPIMELDSSGVYYVNSVLSILTHERSEG